MFILLGGGILVATFTLLIEFIKRIQEKRKIEQIKMKNYPKKAGRSKSLIVKENTTEFIRPSTTY